MASPRETGSWWKVLARQQQVVQITDKLSTIQGKSCSGLTSAGALWPEKELFLRWCQEAWLQKRIPNQDLGWRRRMDLNDADRLRLILTPQLDFRDEDFPGWPFGLWLNKWDPPPWKGHCSLHKASLNLLRAHKRKLCQARTPAAAHWPAREYAGWCQLWHKLAPEMRACYNSCSVI